MSYLVRRPSQRQERALRGLRFQLHRWPGADLRPVVLVHGWGDTGETWQFMVDSLSTRRSYLALDLRGFGRTQRPDDGYWFPDYLADLEALLDDMLGEGPVDLVGHSMGANIVSLYAGVRPQRVRRLVLLEGFGLPRTAPSEAPARYAQWLDQTRSPASFATYESYEQFIKVLTRRNPRTPRDRLEFVARAWGRQASDDRIELWADPRHKHFNPVLYQRDQAEACWRAIRASVLFVIGGKSDLARRMGDELTEAKLAQLFGKLSAATLPEAGHMVHHEQPEAIAQLIDAFLDRTETSPAA